MKNHSLRALSATFMASLILLSNSGLAANESASWDSLFVGTAFPTKGDTGLPEDMTEDDVQLPLEERAPASVPAKKTSTVMKDGIELKVRHKQQVSAIWLLKRAGRFELVFATNGGSRVNMTVPAEQFYALKNAATDLRAPASDVKKCKDSFVQLNVITEGSKGNTVAACLNAKGKAADELRRIGAALSSFVR